MKKNIVINETRSALVISNNLTDAINQVASDCAAGEEIYAFDTHLHLCYCCKATAGGGFKVIEKEIPLKDFRSFLKYNDGDYSKVYKYLIRLFIND